MTNALSRTALEPAHCWVAEDHVPRQPELTGFRRGLRYQQARWREAHGHPIGSHPIVRRDGKPWQAVGSRLPLDYARETGATFLAPAALGRRTSRRTRASITSACGRTSCGRWRSRSTLRRPGRRPRAGRPGRAHVVAGRARQGDRRSMRALRADAIDAVNGTELIHIWLDHWYLPHVIVDR